MTHVGHVVVFVAVCMWEYAFFIHPSADGIAFGSKVSVKHLLPALANQGWEMCTGH
jgi:hypothetical protein